MRDGKEKKARANGTIVEERVATGVGAGNTILLLRSVGASSL